MLHKLTCFIIIGSLLFCTSTVFAGLLDGTTWIYADRYTEHHLAFYKNHMFVRATARTKWSISVLPYLSFPLQDGTINYINFYASPFIPALMWGNCDIEAGEGTYNAIGLLFFVIPFADILPDPYPYQLWRTVSARGTAPLILTTKKPDV